MLQAASSAPHPPAEDKRSSRGGSAPPPKEYQFKVLVIGDPCVGKTSIVNRLVHGAFSMHYETTVGVEFALKILRRPDATVRLQLRDIAGQERSGTLTRVYYKEAAAAFVVFDLTRWETLESVRAWKRDLDLKLSSQEFGYLPAILMANKSDLPAHPKISEDDLDRFAQEENFAAWFLTSAKCDLNILEAAEHITNHMIEREELMRATKDGVGDSDDGSIVLGRGGGETGRGKCAC